MEHKVGLYVKLGTERMTIEDFCLFVLGFYGPVSNEVMSSRSVNSCTVPGQAYFHKAYAYVFIVLKGSHFWFLFIWTPF